jgi:hypothetical protein
MHQPTTARAGASAAAAADRVWSCITKMVFDPIVVKARENANTLTDRDRGV